MSFNWQCPFCQHDTTITEPNHYSGETAHHLGNSISPRTHRVSHSITVCPNPDCKRFTLWVGLHEFFTGGGRWRVIQDWRLIPPSQAKAYPDYIPKAILDDYKEACLIRDLSPKASATLARRCLQGMIRDFWRVSKRNLKKEIEAIKDRVDPLTWGAIDAVRGIGNIGAHMEKNINLIIDVDPDEAAQLIGLIELLLRDWYVARHEREERLKTIVSLGDKKEKTREELIERPESTQETPTKEQ